jgi:hypothetical protein
MISPSQYVAPAQEQVGQSLTTQHVLNRGITKTNESIQACKTRTVLTEEQAVDIFKVKMINETLGKLEIVRACDLATKYRVNEKTIRDIWKARTWSRETLHLDPARTTCPDKLPGRPRGSTDKKQRTRQAVSRKRPLTRAEQDAGGLARTGECDLERRRPADVDSQTDSSGGESGSAGSAAGRRPISPAGGRGRREMCCAESLPASSSREDPFHDDWAHWTASPRAGDCAEDVQNAEPRWPSPPHL